jgi:transcriptional regulator with XRE-family HTH domain
MEKQLRKADPLAGGLSFAQRLVRLRQRKKLTQDGLADLILEDTGYAVSKYTLRDMESSRKPYKPPKKWQRRSRYDGSHRSAIEAIAQVVGVDVGYLLAGFDREDLKASCFWQLIEAGKIVLRETVDDEVRPLSFREFLSTLPNSEAELLNFPWHSVLNEQAFALIFRLEQMFDRLEMLLVNEPPLIFWDDEDVEEWIKNMALGVDDAQAFRKEFFNYREHFRHLARIESKHYKVVVNLPSFRAWLKRKDPRRAVEQLDLMRQFNQIQTFSLAFFSGGDRIVEAEVISGLVSIPPTYEKTWAVQIEQSPPHGGLTEYFVTPRPRNNNIIKKQRERIDDAWDCAIAEMFADARTASVAVKAYREATDFVLKRAKEEIAG